MTLLYSMGRSYTKETLDAHIIQIIKGRKLMTRTQYREANKRDCNVSKWNTIDLKSENHIQTKKTENCWLLLYEVKSGS